MRNPMGSALFPEAAILGFAFAIVGAMIGAWVGSRLAADQVERPPILRPLAVGAAVVLAALVVYGLRDDPTETVRAQVQVQETQSGAQRAGHLTVDVDPPRAAEDAEWFTVTAWQGGGSMVQALERTGDGRWRTTEPVPLHGTWKSLIRLHKGSALGIVPVFLPEDPAIPAREIPAPASFERDFVAEPKILLREQTGGGGLTSALAYAVVAAIALGLLALIASRIGS
jgi:hypothetical protein